MKHWMLTILFMSLLVSTVQAQFAGGSGTEDEPYQAATAEQLEVIGEPDHLDNYFIHKLLH